MGSIERRLERLESAQTSPQIGRAGVGIERREVLNRLSDRELDEYEALFSAETVSGEEPILIRVRELEKEVRDELASQA